ncbi:MAG: DUF3606 domain-containing protein [Phenylobacterium sp.]|jgi:hypothetical protein|uniref:DUF3606 domain-containing protein n=1 Tax=Phenylobacterium sp. TaxID=1871053 RepID=UPI002A2E630F|nr:DUF3606 domain-containing protein [Phenylobacterium sp.]MDD3838072.1 DUF3606 domain-containing protein [Phenylobacterium sp.]MDX9997623.1 DUF3606 domain-containing protein [Phenylobacterium sp.]
MRPDEPRAFEPPPLIDPKDHAQLTYWSERLDATVDELKQAIRQVGPNRTAVAIWLGRGDAV